MKETIVNIKCDICKKEVDMNKDTSLGMITISKVVTKLNMTNRQTTIRNIPELSTEKEIENINLDMCGECCSKVENFVNTIKKV
jgi:hypothetical protein